MDKKPVTKTQPYTIYLGKTRSAERYARLKELADKHAEGSRSKLIQMIADGFLTIQDPRDHQPQAS
jgi:hypothetical protein